MVDSMANSVEDYLIDGLSFKLSPGASYVTDRRSVNFFAAGSNIYTSSSGARVIRINITGDYWLDPSTIRVAFTLVNNDNNVTHLLRPVTGGWGFFRRARCLVGGTIIDDIDYYNRVHEMMHILTSKANRDNDEIEGFNVRWDSDQWYNNYSPDYPGLPGGANGKKRNSFKPLFGICNQPKYIPLSYAPLTMEFELVNQATDPIISIGTGPSDFTGDNTSNTWQIEDVRIICDVVTLDNALQNSYAEHVLSGKALPINYSTFITQYQTLTSSDSAVNVTRAVSRLKSVFINFDAAHNTNNSDGAVVHSVINTFMGPMTNAGTYFSGAYNYLRELQWQLQIGSKMFPEFPCGSLSETFYQLKKALGIHGSAFHSIAITPMQYRNDHFIIGIDTEKILEAGFTGLNTRAGDLMIVRIKPQNGSVADMPLWATSMFIMLHADQILEIRDVGCQVFD